MKPRKINLVFDCFVCLLALFFSNLLCPWGPDPVQAGINEWSRVGPKGGTVQALAVDPSNSETIYAGTWDGVFKSTDAGETWDDMNAGLTSQLVNTLAIDSGNSGIIYAGTETWMNCLSVF